jgi:hypothetical protein
LVKAEGHRGEMSGTSLCGINIDSTVVKDQQWQPAFLHMYGKWQVWPWKQLVHQWYVPAPLSQVEVAG